GEVAINRSGALWKNQQHAPLFQTHGACLHRSNKIHVRINRNDLAELSQASRERSFPIVAVSKDEQFVDDESLQNGNNKRPIEKGFVIGADQEWRSPRQLLDTETADSEKYPREKFQYLHKSERDWIQNRPLFKNSIRLARVRRLENLLPGASDYRL